MHMSTDPFYVVHTCTHTVTTSGTTGAEGLNTDQIIGTSVGIAGAAAAIVAAIITACKCCKFTFYTFSSNSDCVTQTFCSNIRR